MATTVKIMSLYPYNLADGGPAKWDEIKQDVAARLLEDFSPFVKNLGEDNIRGRYVLSPLDIAGRNINNVGGTCHGGAETQSQLGENATRFWLGQPPHANQGLVSNWRWLPSRRIGNRGAGAQRGLGHSR